MHQVILYCRVIFLRIENVELSTCRECRIVNEPRLSNYRVENVKLSTSRECQTVESRMSHCRVKNVGLSTSRECLKFPKKCTKTQKVKKKLHVTILKMNSLHSLHMTCRIMNSRHVNSICRHQFKLDITNHDYPVIFYLFSVINNISTIYSHQNFYYLLFISNSFDSS